MTLRTAVVSVLTILLMVCSFAPLVADLPQAVGACPDCVGTGATIELAYDTGIPVNQMADQMGVCGNCLNFQGVLFTLPEGISSSVLRKVRFYAGGAKSNVGVYIYDTYALGFVARDRVWETVIPVLEEQWYEVGLPDVEIPNSFWVFLEPVNHEAGPFYDERLTVRPMEGDVTGYPRYSYTGVLADQLVPGTDIDAYKAPQGDFLIRADIVSVARVGKGQDYSTIQKAIDSVSEGWKVVVYPGTYNENVIIDKSLTVEALEGPAKTIVQTSPPYSDNSVFSITADCVRLSGFTIQSASYAGKAGVYIDEASGNVVSGNVIQDCSYGIYVSDSSTCNILLENECKYNTTGIYVDGSENCISGNKLHGNTAIEGAAVFVSSIALGNQLRFNTVTVDGGTDPAVAASPQVYNQSNIEEVSAVENWWGTDTGPSNAGGQGPAVGDTVLADPWLAKQPVRVKTAAARAGPFWLESRAETSTVVVKNGIGSAFISVASFAENPVGKFRYKTPGKWIDVLVSSAKGIDEVEIRVYYTADEGNDKKVGGLKESSLRLFWWNGEKWGKCSKTGVDKDGDFVWANLNLKSKPTPNDLAGTMFAVGVPKGGFAWWLIPLIFVLVIIALVLIRLFWVLVAQRGRYPVD